MPTRAQYRRWAAQELGPYYEYASGAGDGASATTVTVGRLASSASVADILTDMGVIIGAATGTDQDERYVTTVSSSGVVTVDRGLSATAVWNSKTIEFHGVVKLLAEWDRLLTDTLKRIGTTVEFTVTPVTDAQRHSLTSAASWLTQPQWVREVGFLGTGEVRAEVNPYGGRTLRGETERLTDTVYLTHPGQTFTSTDTTLYVKAWRPYYTLCKPSAGAYGDQSGLSADTDEAIPPVEWVGLTMLCLWAERELESLGGNERKNLEDRQLRWATRATEQREMYGGELPPRSFRPYQMRGWPSLSSWR